MIKSDMPEAPGDYGQSEVIVPAPPKPKRVRKPKAKKKPAVKKRNVAKKTKPKAKPAKRRIRKPRPTKAAPGARSERLDMRLTKAEKVKVLAKAKKLRRTVTSIVIEAIEKIR